MSLGFQLYIGQRIGKRNNIFYMPKFRTMKVDTPQIATHLIKNPNNIQQNLESFLEKQV